MSCIATSKTGAPLERLVGLNGVGADGSVRLSWEAGISYPDQQVQVIYRSADFSDVFEYWSLVTRDLGTVNVTGLVPEATYIFWIRPELSNYYGQWQSMVGTAVDGWASGLEAVEQEGTLVIFNGEPVLVPTQTFR